jgi:hypothetical protein
VTPKNTITAERTTATASRASLDLISLMFDLSSDDRDGTDKAH